MTWHDMTRNQNCTKKKQKHKNNMEKPCFNLLEFFDLLQSLNELMDFSSRQNGVLIIQAFDLCRNIMKPFLQCFVLLDSSQCFCAAEIFTQLTDSFAAFPLEVHPSVLLWVEKGLNIVFEYVLFVFVLNGKIKNFATKNYTHHFFL